MGEVTWLAALLLGLAGGAHCAGMCGGIVAALPGPRDTGKNALSFILAYHGGRALSYALAGAIVGALGHAGLQLRGSAAMQQVAFAFASLALVFTGIYLAGYTALVHRIEVLGFRLWKHIEPWSRSLFPVTTPLRALSLGMAWGWLPCGMVYGALLLALSSGNAGSAALTMVAFALGTLPSLLAVGYFARSVTRRPVSLPVRRAAAVAVIGAGAYGLMHLSAHAAPLVQSCRLG